MATLEASRLTFRSMVFRMIISREITVWCKCGELVDVSSDTEIVVFNKMSTVKKKKKIKENFRSESTTVIVSFSLFVACFG